MDRELEELEQAALDERLKQADRVPAHQPPTAEKAPESKSLPHTHVLFWSDIWDEPFSRADDKGSRRRR